MNVDVVISFCKHLFFEDNLHVYMYCFSSRGRMACSRWTRNTASLGDYVGARLAEGDAYGVSIPGEEISGECFPKR